MAPVISTKAPVSAAARNDLTTPPISKQPAISDADPEKQSNLSERQPAVPESVMSLVTNYLLSPLFASVLNRLP